MGFLDAIGNFIGGGGDTPAQYQVDQSQYQLQNQNANRNLLMQALQSSQQQAAPQSQTVYAAPQVGNTTLAPAQMAAYQTGPTSIDASQANQALAQQNQLAAMQLATAQGQGPSVAQQQMTLGNQQNMQAQMSAAASMRGGVNPALAQRELLTGLANANQANNANTSLARAQEELNAQQAAGSTLTSARGQSLDQATTNANLGQQAAQTYNAANQYNAGQTNQFALQQGQMNLQNQQNNAAMTQANQAQIYGQSQSNAALQQQQIQANYGQQANLLGQVLGQSAQATAATQLGAQQDQTSYQDWADAKAGQNQRQSALAGNFLNQAGQGVAGLLTSDERAKEEVDRDRTRPELRAFMDALDPASYQYKREEDGVGRKWGVMAQSLQQSEAGRSLVKETPRGLALDTTTGFGTLLAALKDVHERTRKLEEA